MSGVFYYFPHYVFPSIRLCCPFAHSWVEPRVEQNIHVAFIIVETRLTFHQLLVAFISRFKLTLSPCNFIWPHFLVCKWGLESRYVFLSPFLCVEFLSLVVAVSVPIYCNVRVPLCPRRTPFVFLCLASIPVRPPVRGSDPSNTCTTTFKFYNKVGILVGNNLF